MKLFAPTFAACFVVAACGGAGPTAAPVSAPPPVAPAAPAAPAGPASAACAQGQGFYAHGCSGGPAFADGCFASCKGGGACAAGFACAKVSVNPCRDQACDACGAEAELCLPALSPPAP